MTTTKPSLAQRKYNSLINQLVRQLTTNTSKPEHHAVLDARLNKAWEEMDRDRKSS